MEETEREARGAVTFASSSAPASTSSLLSRRNGVKCAHGDTTKMAQEDLQ